MRVSVSFNSENCPYGQPIAVIDEDTGTVMGFHRSTIDAYKQKAMLEGTDMAADPDLFARGQCPCGDGACDCGAACVECDCNRGRRRVDAPLVLLPPTVAW